MLANVPLLICVVGPTAIGKTKLAIALAKDFQTEIISADSRQFFKEMRIGTAVPSEEELATVPHHFIQHKSIAEPYTVGDFEKDAIQKITELSKKHKVIIMVGGSGLYVNAVVHGLDKFPAVEPIIREKLNKELQENGLASLQRELVKVDPVYYETADIQNPHRVIRALEVFKGSGKPFSSFLNQQKPRRHFNSYFIGLEAAREDIYNRINKRVDLMMDDGLLKEAEELYDNRSLNALQTVGYKELFAFVDGKYSMEEAISEIKKNTRRFAKRQLTWFRKNDTITWYSIDTPISEIISETIQKNALK